MISHKSSSAKKHPYVHLMKKIVSKSAPKEFKSYRKCMMTKCKSQRKS